MIETTAVFTEARRLLDAGLSIVPIKPDGSKAPAVPTWKPYQTRRATDAEAATWFRNGNGIAVIAGAVSGNVEVLDFDDRAAYDDWRELLETDYRELLTRLVIVQTPNNGIHVWYRCEEAVPGNQKLARRPKTGGGWEVLIETRAEGGYALVPPSPGACHPTGRPYEPVQNHLAALPVLCGADREILLKAARGLNTYVEPTAAPKPARKAPLAPGEDRRPGDDYNAQGDWTALLTRHGWMVDHTVGEVEHWRRPGKSEATSATLGAVAPGILYVFSSNAAPFEADKSYALFGAYALLDHRGDFQAATRALRGLGYGAPPRGGSGWVPTDADIPPEADESAGFRAWEEESVSRPPDSLPAEANIRDVIGTYQASEMADDAEQAPQPAELEGGQTDDKSQKEPPLWRRWADCLQKREARLLWADTGQAFFQLRDGEVMAFHSDEAALWLQEQKGCDRDASYGTDKWKKSVGAVRSWTRERGEHVVVFDLAQVGAEEG